MDTYLGPDRPHSLYRLLLDHACDLGLGQTRCQDPRAAAVACDAILFR